MSSYIHFFALIYQWNNKQVYKINLQINRGTSLRLLLVLSWIYLLARNIMELAIEKIKIIINNIQFQGVKVKHWKQLIIFSLIKKKWIKSHIKPVLLSARKTATI